MENLQKKPSKGILKSSSSFEQQNECQTQHKHDNSADKDIKWDEINILQTLHPPDKDYGHMKIEEPKTPYNYYSDTTDGEHVLDAEALADSIAKRSDELPTVMKSSSDEEEEEEDDFENLTEEEKKKRREFEFKRKAHYNEFQAVKLARKLLEEEDDDDDNDTQQSSSQQPQESADDNDNIDSEDQRNGDHSNNDEVFEASAEQPNDS
ncbi:protein phosphatase inhibitor 2-like [Oppia nitens]|uniref:protein phosphatase inhibitor 2-like n=1 Tax=Oppia nitens TaxID=1686743 RepID=UPI0023DCAF95|nr:protein phosphatase inhibitor 2-like [Oppia nitens]